MTLLWGARTMKPDLIPVPCPICGSSCILEPGPLKISRGERELRVDTWWWQCQGEPCLYPGGAFEFSDPGLCRWQEAQIREIWADRFGEPFPGEVFPWAPR